jgi:hypothetical protein
MEALGLGVKKLGRNVAEQTTLTHSGQATLSDACQAIALAMSTNPSCRR